LLLSIYLYTRHRTRSLLERQKYLQLTVDKRTEQLRVSLNEKEAFLQQAVEKNYTLFFEHDATIECCNLQQTERGIRPKDYFKLEDV